MYNDSRLTEADVKADATQAVAVVLGGGQSALAAHAGVASKALVPFNGKPLGLYVLEALRGSPYVTHIIYVGEPSPLFAPYVDRVVPPGQGMAESLRGGLEAALAAAPPEGRLLAVSADLPWLTAEAVNHAICAGTLNTASRDTASKNTASLNTTPLSKATLLYPIVSKGAAEAQFPGQKRTYARFKEGVFTGGNLIVLRPSMVPTLLPFVDRAYRARKNPLALAALIGPGILLKFVTGRLPLAVLERRVSHLLQGPVRAFVTPYAALGADVDEPEHLSALAFAAHTPDATLDPTPDPTPNPTPNPTAPDLTSGSA